MAAAYRIEVRTAAGARVAVLDTWRNGEWTARVNEHGEISFELPYDETTWAYFVPANRIWLRNGAGDILEKFHVASRKRRHEGAALILEVRGVSLIYQLSREPVTNYETGNEAQTVTIDGDSSGGTFVLRFRGQVTGAIAYDADAATVEAALEALSTIGSGNVAVTGDTPEWEVEFQGDLAETDVPLLRGNGASLTGGHRRVKIATTRSAKTVDDVVQAILDTFQLNATTIGFGSIDAAIGDESCTLTARSSNIARVLEELRGRWGGYQHVDPADGEFYWKRRIGDDTGQYIRIGFNGQGFEETEDLTGLATRIIAFGAGETPETALTVTKNDATAQTAYGILTDIIVNKDITDATELGNWAQANLDARKVPRKSYTVPTINVATLNEGDYSFHELQVGSHIKVMDSALGVTLETTIGTIRWNLDDPLDIEVTVTNPDAGNPTWGGAGAGSATSYGNEAGALPAIARPRDAADTIADILAAILEEKLNAGAEYSTIEMLEQYLPEAFETTVSTDDLYQQLAALVDEMIAAGSISTGSGGGTPASTPPPAVTEASAQGTGTDYARNDHTHQGVAVYLATTKAGLSNTSIEGSAIARVTAGSEQGRMYTRNADNDGWEGLNFLE